MRSEKIAPFYQNLGPFSVKLYHILARKGHNSNLNFILSPLLDNTIQFSSFCLSPNIALTDGSVAVARSAYKGGCSVKENKLSMSSFTGKLTLT